jgi:glycosyltransferase involved in cell wall biosynthesis
MTAALIGRPHVWHIREFGDLDYQLKHDWGVHLFQRVLNRASAKVAVSNAVRSHVLPGALAQNSYVIYNGIALKHDFDRFRARKTIVAKTKLDFTFAILGLLAPWKGQEDAIRGFAEVARADPHVRLLIAGGSHEGYLEAYRNAAISLGIADKVEFLGYVDDPYEVYFQADAVLVCARNEGMGRVTVEAMSACCPVIGFDAGGTSELIQDGETGLLYRGGADELAQCMLRLVRDRAKARELGLCGWYAAREHYTIERYAEQVHDVLVSVCRER